MSTPLPPGTSLGRYEIRELVGVGGMGEVYRAQDTRIGREVAVKVLTPGFAADPERLRRFEQEAQAAGALNHPNIITVHDVGSHQGSPYVVSELLAGDTLRTLLSAPLPVRKAVDYAVQIARGLAAAHEKGIVHRDLKPENLFLTTDGRVKILDFGVAKLVSPEVAGHASEAATSGTTVGTILGTTAYLSPEQVRADSSKIDHRSDIFSLGTVFFEMLTGRRPFRGESTVETMGAILSFEPALPVEAGRNVSPALERILRHCLEKRPDDRYQSARDLSFDLEMMSGFSETSAALPAALPAGRKRRWPTLLALGALLIAVAFGAFFLTRGAILKPPPVYGQLTFRRGTIWSARFAPDGRTVVYSASWGGDPIETFSTSLESTESRSLQLDQAELLAISSSGEMAVQVKRGYFGQLISLGTLAQVPLSGGAPREMLEDVQQADWAPNGQDLAVVRRLAGRTRLEFPVDKVLYETAGWVTYPRVSPHGDRVAFLEHEVLGDDRGWVAIVDRDGNRKRLSGEWAGVSGLAWAPGGNEVWFTATKGGEASALYAVSLSGAQRVVARAPSNLMLHDISHTGAVLLSSGSESTASIGMAPGAGRERDFAWLDWGSVRDLSADGRTLLFTHYGERSGTNYTIYLRRTDGSPAMRLGEGNGWGISPDGKWVIANLFQPPAIELLPTGAGSPRRLQKYNIEQYGLGASWFPDGKRILFIGREANHGMRCYLQDVESGPPHPITPEGVTGTLVSLDGKYVLAADAQQKRALYPVDGGPPRPIPGLAPEEQVIGWMADGRSLFVFNPGEVPIRVYRLDLATGRKLLWKELVPSDPAGILPFIRIFVTPDGRSYVYGLTRSLYRLYLVEGLS